MSVQIKAAVGVRIGRGRVGIFTQGPTATVAPAKHYARTMRIAVVSNVGKTIVVGGVSVAVMVLMNLRHASTPARNRGRGARPVSSELCGGGRLVLLLLAGTLPQEMPKLGSLFFKDG
jgi:hypothetical protein